MYVIVFYLGAFFLIIILLFLLTWFSPTDSPWSPWWRTDKKTARAICRIAKLTSKDVVYELGSGEGDFLMVAAREFGAKAVGIESDFSRVLYSKLRIKVANIKEGQIKIIKNDFKKIDISDATVVYLYLVPRALALLIPKLKKELRKGTRIVSHRYKISELKQRGFDQESSLYLYTI